MDLSPPLLPLSLLGPFSRVRRSSGMEWGSAAWGEIWKPGSSALRSAFNSTVASGGERWGGSCISEVGFLAAAHLTSEDRTDRAGPLGVSDECMRPPFRYLWPRPVGSWKVKNSTLHLAHKLNWLSSEALSTLRWCMLDIPTQLVVSWVHFEPLDLSKLSSKGSCR